MTLVEEFTAKYKEKSVFFKMLEDCDRLKKEGHSFQYIDGYIRGKYNVQDH